MTTILPLPAFYDPANVVNDTRWINYAQLQDEADKARRQFGLKSASTDRFRIGVLAIDVQNTFCHPQGELYVAGMSGTGAVDDAQRLVEFIYRNLGVITKINCTLDTHRMYAIFHPTFLVDDQGRHPAPFTNVTHADVVSGKWQPSPRMTSALGISPMAALRHLAHYTAELEKAGRYNLTIWPYHGILGDKGHSLVSGLAEVVNYHGLTRGAQPGIEVKGTHTLVEEYSILGPEVRTLGNGQAIPRRTELLQQLTQYDALVITGQAKSHCVGWTIEDYLAEILTYDPELARKAYLLEDCTTSIVVKDPKNGSVIYDYGPEADAAFDRFRNAGMNVVRSTDPIETWPGIRL